MSPQFDAAADGTERRRQSCALITEKRRILASRTDSPPHWLDLSFYYSGMRFLISTDPPRNPPFASRLPDTV
jgi:hypothetical protein